MPQAVDEFGHIVLGIEAQPMHTRVELDMYGPAGDALLARGTNEGIHQSERIYLGLQIVVEECLKRCHLGVHHHDISRNTSLTQGHTLISHGHCQIVHAVVLQCLGNLNGSGTIGIGLDHAHHLRIGLQERAEMIQIVDHRLQVHLQDGLMDFLLQQLADALEAEAAGTLQQYDLIAQLGKHLTADELLHITEEIALRHINECCLTGYLLANANELADAPAHAEAGHLTIE